MGREMTQGLRDALLSIERDNTLGLQEKADLMNGAFIAHGSNLRCSVVIGKNPHLRLTVAKGAKGSAPSVASPLK